MDIITSKKITWIDIKNPKKSDIEYLKENHNFHPIILEELLLPTIRPKVEEDDHYLFMVLHFPIFNPREKKIKSLEIDFLITSDTLITIHYDDIPPYNYLRLTCNENYLKKERCFGDSVAKLLYNIIKSIFDFSFKELDHIQRNIDRLEESMFKSKEKEMVTKLSLAKKDILDFNRTIHPQKPILVSLSKKGVKFFGRKYNLYFSDILGEYIRLKHLTENHRKFIDALNKTNESLLTIKTNEIMKLLTIFAVIVFPLTLISSIFGMNTEFLPIVGQENDFWIIIGFMVAGTLGMLGFFKWKKWL